MKTAATDRISDVLSRLREIHANLSGKRFYCNALSGGSDFNICINADMTVSCNCKDYDGSGIIGDLNRQSFADMFSGQTAHRFRQRLAQGKLPLRTCSLCSELRIVPASEAQYHVLNFLDSPAGIMVENTSCCNLKCIACDRTAVHAIRKNVSMSLDNVRSVSRILKQHRIQKVFYANLGEPFLSRTIRQEMEIFREGNPDLFVGASTNGICLDSDDKRTAALQFDFLVFTIAGYSQASAERYQKGTDFDKAYENVKRLVAFRNEARKEKPTIVWKYLLFNWNDKKRQIERVTRLAQEAGVDCLELRPTAYPISGVSYRSIFRRIWMMRNARESGMKIGEFIDFKKERREA